MADVPSVQVRLGRADADLRAARIVVLDVARRWDEAVAAGDPAGLAAAAADVPLAKLVATRAAVSATDEALRIAGGPGFLAGPLERAFRDARAGLINPPLEDVALAGFARSILDRVGGRNCDSSQQAAHGRAAAAPCQRRRRRGAPGPRTRRQRQ